MAVSWYSFEYIGPFPPFGEYPLPVDLAHNGKVAICGRLDHTASPGRGSLDTSNPYEATRVVDIRDRYHAGGDEEIAGEGSGDVRLRLCVELKEAVEVYWLSTEGQPGVPSERFLEGGLPSRPVREKSWVLGSP